MRYTRRRWLEIGGSSLLGLTWADALRSAPAPASRHPARACVVIFLWGGPGQQDLWDVKPLAPAEVRGEARPIRTSVPGMLIGDGLPCLARQADRFTLVRSVTHKDFEHGSAAYTALTGHPHPSPGTNTPAGPDDFPTYTAALGQLRAPATKLPGAVVLGPVMHQGNRPPIAGQNAGFLGRSSDPFRIADDPSDLGFQAASLTPDVDVPDSRLGARQALRQRLGPLAHGDAVLEAMDSQYRQAFELLRSPRVRQAFDVSREAGPVRDAYGWSRFGQALLLARRLLEAGVPFLTVNWERQNGDQWDTHKENYPRLRRLLPPFDRGLAAFLADLDTRGLLDSTLVYCLGEFGRTPRMNADAGRDHWPDAYSVLLAGGGIPPGRVIGATDRFAAYPTASAMGPWDIAATLYHLLGCQPDAHLHDRQGRAWILSPGRVVPALRGEPEA
jgi:hypothetical protein